MASSKRPPPNWERLLASSSGDTGAAGAGAADGASLQVQERQLARLWAGYGSIKELTVTAGPRTAPRRLVAKAVDPPRGGASDVGHQRKLRSYAVEAAFYQSAAPRLAQLAASLGFAPSGPASPAPAAAAAAAPPASGQVAGTGSGAGGGSWCWVPEPVVVEAEPPGHFLFVLSDLRPAFPAQPHAYDFEEAKVALEWLASFHAAWWEEDPPEGLWEDGCYWHLATRQEELAQIGGEWGALRKAAAAVDAALRGDFSGGPPGSGGGGGGGGGGAAFRTLCHGDAKSANFMYSADGRAAAAYDFQYVGSGYGAKDVAYLLISSVDEGVLAESEADLLAHYHATLTARLRGLGKGDAAEAYRLGEVLVPHYELAVVDYCRFMAGWGWWGAARYAARRCRDVMGRLPKVIESAAKAAHARDRAMGY